MAENKLNFNNKDGCPHCEFIYNLFVEKIDAMTEREYWILTEIFVYLHDGKDYCDK